MTIGGKAEYKTIPMWLKHHRLVGLVMAMLGGISVALSQAQTDEADNGQRTMDEQSVLSLLPGGFDIGSRREVDNLNKLIKMGDEVYPVLSGLLLKSENRTVSGMILSIFVEGEGDKTIARNAVVRAMEKWKSPAARNNGLLQSAARTLGEIVGGKLEYTFGSIGNDQYRMQPAAVVPNTNTIPEIELEFEMTGANQAF